MRSLFLKRSFNDVSVVTYMRRAVASISAINTTDMAPIASSISLSASRRCTINGIRTVRMKMLAVRIRMKVTDPDELDDLMDEDAYKEYIDDL